MRRGGREGEAILTRVGIEVSGKKASGIGQWPVLERTKSILCKQDAGMDS